MEVTEVGPMGKQRGKGGSEGGFCKRRGYITI